MKPRLHGLKPREQVHLSLKKNVIVSNKTDLINYLFNAPTHPVVEMCLDCKKNIKSFGFNWARSTFCKGLLANIAQRSHSTTLLLLRRFDVRQLPQKNRLKNEQIFAIFSV